jgi:hypothetical protein
MRGNNVMRSVISCAGIFKNSRRSKFVARPKHVAEGTGQQENGIAGVFSEKEFFCDVGDTQKSLPDDVGTMCSRTLPTGKVDMTAVLKNFNFTRASTPLKPSLVQWVYGPEKDRDLPLGYSQGAACDLSEVISSSNAGEEMHVLNATAANLLPAVLPREEKRLTLNTSDNDKAFDDGVTSRKRSLHNMLEKAPVDRGFEPIQCQNASRVEYASMASFRLILCQCKQFRRT